MTENRYFQHTVARAFSCIGQGLHTGQRVVMTVMPAEANSGWTFVRRDLPEHENKIRAIWFNVSDTRLCTTIKNRFGHSVNTVEHLLAALAAHGVNNARIVLDGPEVPIADGCARTFSDLILSVGRARQSARRKAIVVKRVVEVTDTGRRANFTPAPARVADLEIDFPSQAIGRQKLERVCLDEATFIHNVRDARTFGLNEQLETLKALGFARGASLDNALLVDEDQVVNPGGLRFPDEFVRHKLLDLYGDLALAGAPVIGHFRGYKSGHQLNYQAISSLMSDPDNFVYTDLEYAEKYWPAISYKLSFA